MIGTRMRLTWWHEPHYLYAGVGISGWSVFTPAHMQCPGTAPIWCIPYGTLVDVIQQIRGPKYSVELDLNNVRYSAHVRKQWLTNKLVTPRVGQMVKTRQMRLLGAPELPGETPSWWRDRRHAVVLREKGKPSPIWLVAREERGFLQLNNGAWVSCGDVYVPSQLKD